MLTSTSGGDRKRYKEKRFFPILAKRKDEIVRVFLRYFEIKFIQNTG